MVSDGGKNSVFFQDHQKEKRISQQSNSVKIHRFLSKTINWRKKRVYFYGLEVNSGKKRIVRAS